MLPAKFEYSRPETLDEALSLLSHHGDEAKVLAGGMSLIPMMKLRILSPGRLIDVSRLSLSYIREEDGEAAIGGLTTHYTVESSEQLATSQPLLPETARTIGDVQVRNRGTIGGSLAHADPSADLPAAVLALDARIVATSSRGSRTIAADDLFQGMLTTSLEPDELITEVRVPAMAQRTGAAYVKVPHKASYFAVVGVAAVLTLSPDGACSAARIAVTGVSFNAYRATGVEAALVGRALDDATIRDAAHLATSDQHVLSDVWASAEYRTHLCSVFVERAVRFARDRTSA
jgi:carbon-monoxide dehydrogenase medium subunit